MGKFKVGVGFDELVARKVGDVNVKIKDERAVDFRRGFVLWLVILVGMFILLIRSAELQLFYGGKYRQLADENRIKKIKIMAERGKIIDRQGKVLATGNREYPFGARAGHLLGFLGEVKEDEVGLLRPNGGRFDVGDLIGRSGVEEAWDERLRGMDGGRLVEVDNTGEQVRELGMKLPVAGQEVKLALDMELQQVADEAMGKHVGAVVASNPKTGGVLVMVSKPGFDPNTIYDEYANLISQDGRPLVNRAIGGIYPPGSTFKMVTTVAALESGKLPLAYTYQDTGVVSVGTYRYTNWFFTQSGGVEGVIGFRKAIARSTDTFFYKVGEETGVMEIAKWAQEFGLGHKTGVEIAGEVEGLVPDPDWKKAVKKEAWFLGDTFIMSIGQGDLLTTPAQVNRMTNVIASRGQKCSLSLIEMERPCEAMMVDEKIWDVVQRGMLDACSTGGTAYPFFDWNQKFEQKVACKTGTAEYLMKDGKTGTHAWLTAYAPADAPTISVTVLIEAGGEGSRTAAPVVRKVLARYFGVEDNFDYQGYLPRGE